MKREEFQQKERNEKEEKKGDFGLEYILENDTRTRRGYFLLSLQSKQRKIAKEKTKIHKFQKYKQKKEDTNLIFF